MSSQIKFVDLYAQYLTIKMQIDTAIEGVIRDAAFVGGVRVTCFEDRFAAFQQAKHCVAVGNGTDSIEIALQAMDLPLGSEVIVPANSFIASSEAVTNAGHKVVFADINPATYTLDPADIARRITSRTKAIIAVHLYGHPCDMAPLMNVAERHGLKVIEDCAQAHGAEYRGRRVGAIGHVGTFSFYPGKNLGAYGDAGAILTNDDAMAKRCRMIANHGRIDKYDHQFEGRNSRLDGIQAAILDVKLDHLERWIEVRNHIASEYLQGLGGLDNLVLPTITPGVRHVFHLFVIRTRERAGLVRALESAGIQYGIHYPIALPKLKAYEYLGQADAPFIANRIDGELLSLPIGEHITKDDAQRVCQVVRHWCEGRN